MSFSLWQRHVVAVLLLAGCAETVSAQQDGHDILSRVEKVFAGIRDYTVSLEVNVDLDRLKVPKMNATMYFKQPDKTHFVSEGFALLPKAGLSFSPGSLTSRYEVERVSKDSATFILTLKPKQDRSGIRKVFLTVDTLNWTVASITTPQGDGRQMSATFSYQRVDGHWLPAALNVTFSSDTTDAEPADPFGQMPGAVRSSQIPRTGTITIRYSDYKINTGLTDAIFESKVNK